LVTSRPLQTHRKRAGGPIPATPTPSRDPPSRARRLCFPRRARVRTGAIDLLSDLRLCPGTILPDTGHTDSRGRRETRRSLRSRAPAFPVRLRGTQRAVPLGGACRDSQAPVKAGLTPRSCRPRLTSLRVHLTTGGDWWMTPEGVRRSPLARCSAAGRIGRRETPKTRPGLSPPASAKSVLTHCMEGSKGSARRVRRRTRQEGRGSSDVRVVGPC
jgi:hypothetical protein